MVRWTLAQIRTQVQRNLDIQEEKWITEEELDAYINEAVDDIEAEVVGLYEDYFITHTTLSLVQDQKEYDLPADIYADKIRAIIYDDNIVTYPIKRIKNLEELPYYDDYASVYDYRYILFSDPVNGSQINIYPAPLANDTTNVTLYYLRNANRLELDADEFDIPEALNYLIKKVEFLVLKKEGNPMMMDAKDEIDRQRLRLHGVLAARVPDEDYLLRHDLTFYAEFDPYEEY